MIKRKAFTMIELIFVIVIIGILAAVALPKLAASRDDAEATVCVHEVAQLINEIASEYAKVGNSTFKSEKISAMTNVKIRSGSETRGIKVDTTVDSTGIIYVCENEDIVTVVGQNAGTEYNLSVTVTAGTVPASKIATDEIIQNVIGGVSSKIFEL